MRNYSFLTREGVTRGAVNSKAMIPNYQGKGPSNAHRPSKRKKKHVPAKKLFFSDLTSFLHFRKKKITFFFVLIKKSLIRKKNVIIY